MPTKINVKGVIISNDEKWIYDWFEMENTSPNDVLNQLPYDNSDVEVVVNSGGGSVFAGSEIYTALKEYPGNVTVKVVGVAASAASVIAMAGNKVVISPTAQIMIHNVSSVSGGDYRALQHDADMLKNYNKSIANAYQLKSGKSQDEILHLMNKETWFNAQQALEYGLVDEIMFQNETPQLVAGLQNGMLPMNIIEKMRNMKNNLSTASNVEETEDVVEEEIEDVVVEDSTKDSELEEIKNQLLFEIELI